MCLQCTEVPEEEQQEEITAPLVESAVGEQVVMAQQEEGTIPEQAVEEVATGGLVCPCGDG